MHDTHDYAQNRTPDVRSVATDSPSPKMEDFTAIYDLYQESIFRYCLFKSRDREVSQDLMQETFLRFWVFLQTREKIQHARGFLYKIAFNLFVDHVRKKKAVSLDQLSEAGFEPVTDPWQKTRDDLDWAAKVRKLNAIRNPHKHVLHQRFMLGLAPAEIAAMTGETSNVISVRIDRGLKHLRKWSDRRD